MIFNSINGIYAWQKNLHLSLSFEEQNEFDLHYPSFSFTKKKEPKKRVQSIQKQNCSVAELLPLEIIMGFNKNEVYALGISDTPKIKIQKYFGDLNKPKCSIQIMDLSSRWYLCNHLFPLHVELYESPTKLNSSILKIRIEYIIM